MADFMIMGEPAVLHGGRVVCLYKRAFGAGGVKPCRGKHHGWCLLAKWLKMVLERKTYFFYQLI